MPFTLHIPRREIISIVLGYLVCQPVAHGSTAATHLYVTHVGPCEVSPTIIKVKEMVISTQIDDSVVSGQLNITEDVDDGWSVKATMQKCQDIRNTDTCDHFSTYPVISSGCSEQETDQVYAELFRHTEPEQPNVPNYLLQSAILNIIKLSNLCDSEKTQPRSYIILNYLSTKISTESETACQAMSEMAWRMKCPVRAGVYKLEEYLLYTENNVLSVHEAKISTSVFGYRVMLEAYTRDGRKLLCVEADLQLLYLRQHNWLGKQTPAPARPATTASPADDDQY